jgi:hypothetical protein
MRKNQADDHCKVLEKYDEHLMSNVGAAQSTRKMYLRYCRDFLRECVREEIPLESVRLSGIFCMWLHL